MMLSPLVLLLAFVAIADRLRARPLLRDAASPDLSAQNALCALVGFSSLPLQNVRFQLLTDVMLRGLAAVALVSMVGVLPACRRSTALMWAGLCLLAVDLWQFQRIFFAGGVYDPVTFEIARALGFFAP